MRRPIRIRRRLGLGAALIVPAVALVATGCTVGIDPGTTPITAESTPSTSPVPDAARPSAVVTGPAPAPSADPDESSTTDFAWPTEWDDGVEELTRDDILQHTVQRLDCHTGSEQIDGVEVIAQITMPCEHVTVTGTNVIVLADEIGSLSMDTTGGYVAAQSIRSVTTSGVGAHARWRTGVPSSVIDHGVGTTARQGDL